MSRSVAWDLPESPHSELWPQAWAFFESFSIITTDPNELLKPFHNRCPLIIQPADCARWLSPAEPSHLPIDLVRTCPPEQMKAWRVARLKGNGPHLLEPAAEPST